MSNTNLQSNNKNFYRQFFGYRRLDLVPNFLLMMKKSYNDFIQTNPNNRDLNKGLESVFQKTINFEDPKGSMTLKYISYELKEPKFSIEECTLQGMTYGYSLYINCHATFYDKEQKNKNKKVVIHEEPFKVHLGEIPKMCENNSFIINGIYKAIITQIQRIPGIFLISEVKKKKKKISYQNYTCKIIPYLGSWIELFVEQKDVLYFKLDKKKKLLLSTLLLSLARDNQYDENNPEVEGYSVPELLKMFYPTIKCTYKNGYIQRPLYEFDYNNYFFNQDVLDEDKNILIKKGDLFTPNKQLPEGSIVWVHEDDWIPMVSINDLILDNGTILQESSHFINKENLLNLVKNGHKTFEVVNLPMTPKNLIIINTFIEEDCTDREDAYNRIVRSIRINDSNLGQLSSLYSIFINTFFNQENYTFDKVGRLVMNERLGINVDTNILHLTNEDIIFSVKKFLKLIDEDGEGDDIDSLEYKRLRLLGENLTNQCAIGAKKMIKSMKDRLFMGESFINRMKDVISGKVFLYPLKKLFNISMISQFEEQTNLLSSLMHKRRLVYQSITGTMPSGTNKNNKRRIEGIRDNHQSFYGMICPFSTPEGGSIGIVNSLAVYASCDDNGLLQTPYHPVIDGTIRTDKVEYLTANQSKYYVIASVNDLTFENKILKLKDDLIIARKNLDFAAVKPHEVTHVEIASDQILSLACSLIPYAECDDAFRILMASNMIRQAEPLKKVQRPLVGTGIEKLVVDESYNGCLKSPCNGKIVSVDGFRIILLDTDNHEIHMRYLTRFNCSNQNTTYGMRPVVKVGQAIVKGEIIADSECSLDGELSYGSNALVAFIPSAECFEDSIWLNRKYAFDDNLTSFHMKVFEVQIRDSRLGHEMITRDIPGVSQNRLKHLDSEGIVMEGVNVKFGMILVGKVTPKSSHQFVPDQKLLNTIFGEKSAEIVDTSFKAPSGTDGTVTRVEIIRRSGISDDDRLTAIEIKKLYNIKKNCQENISLLEEHLRQEIINFSLDKTLTATFGKFTKGHTITEKDVINMTDNINDFSFSKILTISLDDASKRFIEVKREKFLSEKNKLEEEADNLTKNAKAGRELPAGVLKIIRIHVMEERRIEEGDKLTGRHGNKGVISKISNQEDMPFLEDGTPVHIVMNPIGIKARMNPGLLLESVTGMACVAIVVKMREIIAKPDFKDTDLDEYLKAIGFDIETMTIAERDNFIRNLRVGNFIYGLAAQPFNRPSNEFLDNLLTLGGKNVDGYEKVYDGLTGDLIGNICVGYQYILKLCHMAKDKIHARFTGPYSFISQQPLCGKINYGGQRLGEMEVWALEAYGAAFNIEEMLTIKSDAPRSRYKAAEAIVNGESMYRTLDKPATIMILKQFLMGGGINFSFDYKNSEDKDLDGFIKHKLIPENNEDFLSMDTSDDDEIIGENIFDTVNNIFDKPMEENIFNDDNDKKKKKQKKQKNDEKDLF